MDAPNSTYVQNSAVLTVVQPLQYCCGAVPLGFCVGRRGNSDSETEIQNRGRTLKGEQMEDRVMTNYSTRRVLTVAILLVLGGGQIARAQSPVTVAISKAGTTSFSSAAYAADSNNQTDQFDLALMGDADGSGGTDGFAGVNRTLVGATTGKGRAINSSARTKSNPQLGVNFQGLNFHDQRFANGGNQFSVEPPDQGLCAGNGYVIAQVNDVIQVYDTAGNPMLNGGQAVDLNTFYGYAPAIIRSGPHAGQRGPSVT